MNEQQVMEIVRRETEHLEKRIEQLERDLILTKQHTTQAVQLMAEKFSSELDRVLEEYKDGFSSAAVEIVREELAAHEERLNSAQTVSINFPEISKVISEEIKNGVRCGTIISSLAK